VHKRDLINSNYPSSIIVSSNIVCVLNEQLIYLKQKRIFSAFIHKEQILFFELISNIRLLKRSRLYHCRTMEKLIFLKKAPKSGSDKSKAEWKTEQGL